METLHHPNLIRIFEVIETLSKHYIVMELAPGGELFQVISLQGRLSESEGRFYFSQILSAIEHMVSGKVLFLVSRTYQMFPTSSFSTSTTSSTETSRRRTSSSPIRTL